MFVIWLPLTSYFNKLLENRVIRNSIIEDSYNLENKNKHNNTSIIFTNNMPLINIKTILELNLFLN